ncbi:MAG: GTP-binding protein [Promethearchaeota archaeon]
MFKSTFYQEFEEKTFEKFDLIINTIQRSLPPIISLVGYAGVGKTRITEITRTKTIPLQKNKEIAADIATVKIGQFHFLLRDFTGQEQFIFLWKNFIKGSNLILLITDSTSENIEKSKFFLNLIEEETPDARVAIIANKQDLESVVDSSQIQDIFGLKTYPMIAENPANKFEMIKLIIDLIEPIDDISSLLSLQIERENLISELKQTVEDEKFEDADLLFRKIISLCIKLKDNPIEMDFYNLGQKIKENLKKDIQPHELPMTARQSLTQEVRPQRISLKEKLLKSLLFEYMSNIEGILAVTISDREGFIITSESREKNGDDSVLGAVAVALDRYIDRIKKEFGSESSFFNVTILGNKKFVYCSMGTKSILTTVSMLSTSDTELRVFSEHIAKKIELILEGNENISLKIPDIIKILAKTKSGTIPTGDFSTKLILTGDFAVGKTSLILKFVQNLFYDSYSSTIGVDISQKEIKIGENTKIKFVIWDIGGQITQMAPYRKRFYQGANSAFIVVDRTRPDTLDSVETWYNDIKKHIPYEMNIIIVGNKSDLVDQINISEDDIRIVAEKFGFHYIFTSAKSGENVNESFLYIAYKFLESI